MPRTTLIVSGPFQPDRHWGYSSPEMVDPGADLPNSQRPLCHGRNNQGLLSEGPAIATHFGSRECQNSLHFYLSGSTTEAKIDRMFLNLGTIQYCGMNNA